MTTEIKQVDRLEFIVVRWNGVREVGVDHDGVEHNSLDDAEIMTASVARDTAATFGGKVINAW